MVSYVGVWVMGPRRFLVTVSWQPAGLIRDLEFTGYFGTQTLAFRGGGGVGHIIGVLKIWDTLIFLMGALLMGGEVFINADP